MTPEDIKDLKILMATLKFDIKSDLAEIIGEEIDKILGERWKSEVARRREATW